MVEESIEFLEQSPGDQRVHYVLAGNNADILSLQRRPRKKPQIDHLVEQRLAVTAGNGFHQSQGFVEAISLRKLEHTLPVRIWVPWSGAQVGQVFGNALAVDAPPLGAKQSGLKAVTPRLFIVVPIGNVGSSGLDVQDWPCGIPSGRMT
jgi:hypothetical protein